MRNRFVQFTFAEEVFTLPFLSWAYSLNPTNRDFFVALMFVLVCGFALALANALVYQFNKKVIWSQLRTPERILRIAASAIMTDAVFYAVYSCIHALTGLWLSSGTPSSIAIVAGLSVGVVALMKVVTLNSHDNPDDDVGSPQI